MGLERITAETSLRNLIEDPETVIKRRDGVLTYNPALRKVNGSFSLKVILEDAIVPANLKLAAVSYTVDTVLPKVSLPDFDVSIPLRRRFVSLNRNPGSSDIHKDRVSPRSGYIPFAVLDPNLISDFFNPDGENKPSAYFILPRYMNLQQGPVLVAVDPTDLSSLRDMGNFISTLRFFPSSSIFKCEEIISEAKKLIEEANPLS